MNHHYPSALHQANGRVRRTWCELLSTKNDYTARIMRGIQIAICFPWLTTGIGTTAAPVKIDPNPTALMQAMQGTMSCCSVRCTTTQHSTRCVSQRCDSS